MNQNEEPEPERARAPYVGVTEWRFERNAEEAVERNARRRRAQEALDIVKAMTGRRPLYAKYIDTTRGDSRAVALLEEAARLYECLRNTVDGEWIRHGSRQDVANAKAIREFIRVELCGKAPS